MIQDHPFTPSVHPEDTGDICVWGVMQGETVVHCGKAKDEHEDATSFYRRANPNFDFDRTYYLAGPMSGYEHYNYPAFEAAVRVLRHTGITVLSPHEVEWPVNHKDMDEETLWGYMMNETGKQLAQASGIILLKGWPQSRGAKAELKHALDNDFVVWFYHEFQMTNMNKEDL